MSTVPTRLSQLGARSDPGDDYSPVPPGYTPGRTKYIVITGSVMSGLGKGIFSSGLARLLEDCGLRTNLIKMDGYFNEDAGTLSPYRHGEVFVLDDGTGECIVQPAGAEVLTAETTTWYGDTPWPTLAPGKRSPFGEPDYRYYEERIYEHEQVHVLGHFRTHSGTANTSRDTDVAALLAEWKQDQAALVARFDADGDGQVSLGEWERAREEARHAVTQRHLEKPVPAAVHVISRPDSRQLFLIAAYPEKELAKRFRRRALIAFVGFGVATYALGWLLQGVSG